MSNSYEEKRAAKITRYRERAEKKAKFASENDFSLFGEEKSGIPMGQPILVGHHSEKRHRKHLERIENRVRKGYEAGREADRLVERADTLENRTAIDSDNPEALRLIDEKIKKLSTERERYKTINVLVRKHTTIETLAPELLKVFPDVKDAEKLASKLLTPDVMKCVGIPTYKLINMGAEIRRLEKRRVGLVKVKGGFESFEINGIKVELVEGQVQVEFGFIPSEEIRTKLKCSPLVLKWSRYSKRWVRKHTEATASPYFISSLKAVLLEVQNANV
jgi:hypothetical protein